MIHLCLLPLSMNALAPCAGFFARQDCCFDLLLVVSWFLPSGAPTVSLGFPPHGREFSFLASFLLAEDGSCSIQTFSVNCKQLLPRMFAGINSHTRINLVPSSPSVVT